MKTLVINSGSSTIKYQLIAMPSEKVICKGLVERIGEDTSILHYKTAKEKLSIAIDAANHKKGLEHIAQILMDKDKGVVISKSDIHIVGHRVVHGGNTFSETVFIDEKVKSEIERLASLAPLHNPPNLEGIKVAEEIFPQAKQVAVFDTAFHQSIPEKAYRYAIPKELADFEHIRVYGFHGTSHKYVAQKAIDHLNKKHSKIITIHLGNGCSMTAVQDGLSVDHSLGFGPTNGLIMGTRSGDIDQSVIFFLLDKKGLSSTEVNELLQKKSGLLGITGYSDLRDIQNEADKENKNCLLALEMVAYRIKKYIGSYVAAMNGIDAIVFTAGIGENSAKLRQLVCEDMDTFGIVLDHQKNKEQNTTIRSINMAGSDVEIMVIPTNEELEIAQQSYLLCQ